MSAEVNGFTFNITKTQTRFLDLSVGDKFFWENDCPNTEPNKVKVKSDKYRYTVIDSGLSGNAGESFSPVVFPVSVRVASTAR